MPPLSRPFSTVHKTLFRIGSRTSQGSTLSAYVASSRSTTTRTSQSSGQDAEERERDDRTAHHEQRGTHPRPPSPGQPYARRDQYKHHAAADHQLPERKQHAQQRVG